MRIKKEIYRDYLTLINKEKNLGYSDEQISEKVNSESGGFTTDKLIHEELYSTEEIESEYLNEKGVLIKYKAVVSSRRAWYIWCDIIIKQTIQGDKVWNSFVKRDFEIIEWNRFSAKMVMRGAGKSFNWALYQNFKMYLIKGYEVIYICGVPNQYRKFYRIAEEIIDENELLLDKKDITNLRELKWGMKEMAYNKGISKGITLGTTCRGEHVNLCIVDDPLRDDNLYADSYIIDYILGAARPTVGRKTGRMGISGCVTPDTKVITDNGLEEIGSIIKYDPDSKGTFLDLKKKVFGKEGWDSTSKFYINGFGHTKKITLGNGYSIECSLIHPLWICPKQRWINKKDTRWRQAQFLKLDDWVAIKSGTHSYGKSATISEKEAYLFGLYVAEGSSEKENKRITITNTDNFCKKFLLENKFYTRDGLHFRNSDKKLIQKMVDYGLPFCKAPFKTIPSKIFQEPKNIQTKFLSGLFDGDGHSTLRYDKRNGKTYCQIILTSTSKKLIQDAQIMLLNMGIISSINSASHKGHYKKTGHFIKASHSFSLGCYGFNGIQFLEKIGFKIKGKQKNFSKCNYFDQPDSFGFIWRKIKKIENSHAYTVDFVIPKNHSFVSNGIISHNTPQWEEDLFHIIMNDKLDAQQKPVGKLIENGQISQSGFFSIVIPGCDLVTQAVLIPERWTFSELMVERKQQGEMRFMREIMCRCVRIKGSLVPYSLFKRQCNPELSMLAVGERGKKYLIAVDPATGDSPDADYFSAAVFEETQQGLILRDLVHKRGFPVIDPETTSGGIDDQPNLIKQLYRDFNNAAIVVEKNNAGITLIQILRNKFNLEVMDNYTHQTIDEGKAQDVTDYIQALKDGVVVFPANPEDGYTCEIIEKVKTEHLDFGIKTKNGKEIYGALTGHDDIFTSCWLAWKFRSAKEENIPMPILTGGNPFNDFKV